MAHPDIRTYHTSSPVSYRRLDTDSELMHQNSELTCVRRTRSYLSHTGLQPCIVLPIVALSRPQWLSIPNLTTYGTPTLNLIRLLMP